MSPTLTTAADQQHEATLGVADTPPAWLGDGVRQDPIPWVGRIGVARAVTRTHSPRRGRRSGGPEAYRRSQAQQSEWTRSDKVTVTYRTLKYYADGSQREKGIDVLIAINLVRAVQGGKFDVVILAAHDTDQEPALEAALELSNGVAVESAGWQGCKVLRPGGNRLWHTALDSAAFVRSRDRKDYT